MSGETALYDAAAVALRRLREAGGRRAVVLFTDGEDNRSRMSIDQVIDLARASEASVFAVAQGVAEVEALLRAPLDRLAEETGGRAWFISSIRKLPGSSARSSPSWRTSTSSPSPRPTSVRGRGTRSSVQMRPARPDRPRAEVVPDRVTGRVPATPPVPFS